MEHLKRKKVRNKYNSSRKPWLTKGLLKSINTKHKLFIKMKNNPINLQNACKYKHYRNVLTKLLKSAKKSYYSNKFSFTRGNTNKTWKVINEVLNKIKTKSAPKELNSSNDKPLTNSYDIGEEFNDYFTNIGPNLAASLTNTGDFRQYLTGNQTNSLFFHPVSEIEVFNQIKSINPNKSAHIGHLRNSCLTATTFWPIGSTLNQQSSRVVHHPSWVSLLVWPHSSGCLYLFSWHG